MRGCCSSTRKIQEDAPRFVPRLADPEHLTLREKLLINAAVFYHYYNYQVPKPICTKRDPTMGRAFNLLGAILVGAAGVSSGSALSTTFQEPVI